MTLELQLFGTAELRSAASDAVHRVQAQPKRFALLAYLAMAGRDAMVRRDALLALFWPEEDASRARGALSQALSFLRRSLGRPIIITRGDEEVGVDHSVLTCDVVDFDLAFAAQDYERAIGYYRGPLLDSFHLSGCPGFDRWLDGERTRLAGLALSAVTTLAGRAEVAGDPALCTYWLEHALILAPFDEPIALQLANSRRRCGDRAGALRELLQFDEQLTRELGIVRSRSLARAITTLREDPGISSESIRPLRISPVGSPAVAPVVAARVEDQPRLASTEPAARLHRRTGRVLIAAIVAFVALAVAWYLVGTPAP